MEQLEEETGHVMAWNWHVIIESITDDPRISTAELKACFYVSKN
jgi:hypothetical protein